MMAVFNPQGRRPTLLPRAAVCLRAGGNGWGLFRAYGKDWGGPRQNDINDPRARDFGDFGRFGRERSGLFRHEGPMGQGCCNDRCQTE